MKPGPRLDFTELIPELKKSPVRGKNISPDEWLGAIGKYEHLVAYSGLLWPDFVEPDNCVFRASFSEGSYNRFMAQTEGDKTSVEAGNHLPILDLFCNADPKPTRQVILFVGRLLRDTGRAKPNRDFPDRRIGVSLPEDCSEDLLQYEVTFSQER